MSEIQTYIQAFQFNRTKTLATLAEFEKQPSPLEALAFRPGVGRAHAAWQFMHVAITEEVFSTSRLLGTNPAFPELVERFRGGSTPDDNIPSIDEIKNTLAVAREHLLATLGKFSDQDLEMIPAAFAQRGWTLRTVLQVIAWHEAHHQGQTHITLNMYKARIS
jgi:uncharacterized damage-inducible protein DinB